MDIKNKIIQGDYIEVLKKVPNETFDFCFANPPYFMQIDNNKKLYRVEGEEFLGCNDEWDKFNSFEEYKEWTRQSLNEVRRTLKKDGRFALLPVCNQFYEIGNILRELGYWVINDIVWKKAILLPTLVELDWTIAMRQFYELKSLRVQNLLSIIKLQKYINGGKQMGCI
ncbi:DNA methyltransferase [Metamycoplasma gateae]|uniref:DNA methyltransferase n=1 Tax=Metamycoplasma gateae TaxID=35769 RepID=A0ABZ2AGC2_9BACT|nr:DNA methyltransferase [Metamycoplasma gateae]